MKRVVNTLLIGAVVLLIYLFAGHDYAAFYVGGKAEILDAGERINTLCNANRACPTTIEGWRIAGTGTHLTNGNMNYYVDSDKESDPAGGKKEHQTFKLVYAFFMPDSWFEVQGGVDRKVTSGWKSK